MRKITRLLLITILAFAGAWSSSAQDKNGRNGWQEWIKAEKIAYLTDAMDLSPAEAEKFWPVYNRAESEMRQSWKLIMDAYRALEASVKDSKDDKEISAL